MKKICLSLVLMIGLTISLFSQEPKLISKATKQVVKIIGNSQIDLDEINDFGEEKDYLYHLYQNGSKTGYLVVTSTKGRFDEFDYMILYDSTLKVTGVRVLVYRSSYGGQIMNRKWLGQFNDLKPGARVQYRKDIQAISGATYSAEGITSSINRINSILENTELD